MLTPATTRDGKATIYGFGFFRGGPLGKYRELEEAGHGGDQQGFSSVLYLLPEKEFGVVILSNLEGQQSSLDFIGLSRKIYDIVSQ
jgi:CubicO group peptidase (beta-lactamase class C family)